MRTAQANAKAEAAAKAEAETETIPDVFDNNDDGSSSLVEL